MITPVVTSLFLEPQRVYVAAQVVSLSRQMADELIHRGWWNEDCLKRKFDDPQPIDRFWNWNELEIEFDGRTMESEKIAILAGDDKAVQGAMMISTEPVNSVLDPGKGCLFVELLFTSPRNRPSLRRDGKGFLRAVGTELLTWAAGFSRQKGLDGRLRLDGSPDYLKWYENRGLLRLDLEPILFEDVSYTPMELPSQAAQKLLE